MRVAVVGIGGTGSAAARYLASAGHEVVGYEQFRVGHNQGSSHGESRIIRYTYPDALFTAMMADAYPLWAELEREAGEELFVRCGGLYFGRYDDPSVIATERALVGAGLIYDRLPPGEAQDRFPAFRFRPDEICLYQRESGFLRAGRCVAANAELACAYGADIREETAVAEVVPHGDDVIVVADVGSAERYDRVIVTAGAWISQLFAGLNLRLRVTRQQITYLQIARNADWFLPSQCPVWIDATGLYYGFPRDGRIPGIKFAAHTQGDQVHPDHVPRDVDTDYIAQNIEYASWRMPDLDPAVTASQVCLYTNTANEDFILDHIPGSNNIWLVSGCSGHGFKFTVLLGKIAAELATGGSYERDISRFQLSNFLLSNTLTGDTASAR